MSVDELMTAIASGAGVRAVRVTDGRVVQVTDRRGRMTREARYDLQTYDRVMSELMSRLSEQDGATLDVAIRIDFYGSLSAEVRTGLLNRRRAPLAISPRHLALLDQLIEAKARAKGAVSEPIEP
ncbi:MAG: hypothetical protein ACFCUN_09550 [Hyphomicrobiaceae bacterium]